MRGQARAAGRRIGCPLRDQVDDCLAQTQHAAHGADVILALAVAVDDRISGAGAPAAPQPASPHPHSARWWLELAGPTLVAAAFAIVYVIVRPTSLDLADHLFRAQLFREEGFSVWNNFWYGGHDIPGYSTFFPAASAALTPQDAGAIAAVLTAAVATPARSAPLRLPRAGRRAALRGRDGDRPLHRPSRVRLRCLPRPGRGARARLRLGAGGVRAGRAVGALQPGGGAVRGADRRRLRAGRDRPAAAAAARAAGRGRRGGRAGPGRDPLGRVPRGRHRAIRAGHDAADPGRLDRVDRRPGPPAPDAARGAVRLRGRPSSASTSCPRRLARTSRGSGRW